MKYAIITLNYEMIDEIMECINNATRKIESQDFYFPSNKLDVKNIIAANNYSVGILVENKIVGISLVKYDESSRVFYFEDTVVLKDYRGNHFQEIMWRYQIEHVLSKEVILCTIHPNNIGSLKSALSANMYIDHYEKCYTNLPRYICVYEDTYSFEENIVDTIDITNTEKLFKYINEGYKARIFKDKNTNNLLHIFYR